MFFTNIIYLFNYLFIYFCFFVLFFQNQPTPIHTWFDWSERIRKENDILNTD